MGFKASVRGFLTALRSKEPVERHTHAGHSLAKTLSDSSHVTSAKNGGGGTTEAQAQVIANGHEAYQKSFKKNRDS